MARRDRAGCMCGAGGMRQPVDPNIGCHRSCEAGRDDVFDILGDGFAIPHAVDHVTTIILRCGKFQKTRAKRFLE